MSPDAKAYYAGGARVIVDGVPIRLARKPSVTNLVDLRGFEIDRRKRGYETSVERAKRIAKRAREDIEAYARILGISPHAARYKIAAHREWLIANPVEDNSLEHDL